MNQHYPIVLFNLTAFSLLLLFILFFKFVFPKKNIPPVLLVILFSFLPLFSIFRNGVSESGDMGLHTQWFIAFYSSIDQGILRPIWAKDLFFTYGHPLFLFIYPLPYYLGSIFHLIGFSFIFSIKLIFILSFILSGVFMYLWAKDKVGKIGAAVSAIFYLFNPYHLVDLHFRAAIGENVAFFLLPMILFLTDRFFKTLKGIWLFLLSISIALLILSHQAITLGFLPVLFFYSILILKTNKRKFGHLLLYSCFLILGILITSYFWVPMLSMAGYTYLIPYPDLQFVPIQDLLYSPWRYGFLFQGHKGELSYLIGYTQLFVVTAICYMLIANKIKKADRGQIWFYIALFFVLFFLMLSPSRPIWENIPLLKNFQFTSRLLLTMALLTSLMAGYVVKVFNRKRIIVLLCLLTIGYTALNWSTRRMVADSDDSFLISTVPASLNGTGALWPAATKWYNPEIYRINKIPDAHIERVKGDVKIKEVERKENVHRYKITALENSKIKENTLYFPGWHLFIDGKEEKIVFNDKKYPALILFNLEKGEHDVSLYFKNEKIMDYANLISLASLAMFFFLIAILNKKKSVL